MDDRYHARFPRTALLVFAALSMTACGGGGGSSTPPPPGTNPPSVNNPPIAVITAPEGDLLELSTVTLSAATSSDPDGDALSFEWKQIAGPDAVVTEADQASAIVIVPMTTDGNAIEFAVTVRDENGGSDTATISLVVNDIGAIPVLVYTAIEDVPNVEALYFHHPASPEARKFTDASLQAPVDNGYVGINGVTPLEGQGRIAFVRSTFSDSVTTRRLWVANLDGSGEHDITGNVVDGGNLSSNQIWMSPDKHWIAFIGGLETAGTPELFVISTQDPEFERRKLSGSSTVGSVSDSIIAWLPDSSGIVFVGTLRDVGVAEYYVSDLEGNRRSLSHADTLESGRVRFEFNCNPTISPDSAYIVFCGDYSPDNSYDLLVSRIADGNRTMVHSFTQLRDFTNVMYRVWWSPTSERFAFIDTPRNGPRDLYVFPAGGTSSADVYTVGGATEVDRDGDTVADGLISMANWSPTGDHLAFSGYLTSGSEDIHVFLSPATATDSTSRIQVSPEKLHTGNVSAVISAWTPDSRGLLLSARVVDDTRREYFVFDVDLSALSALSLETPSNTLAFGVTTFSSDFKAVFGVKQLEIDGPGELVRLPLDGNAYAVLTGANPADGDVNSATMSSDGSMLAFSGKIEDEQRREVYVTASDAVDGGSRKRISNALATDGDADGFPDGFAASPVWIDFEN